MDEFSNIAGPHTQSGGPAAGDDSDAAELYCPHCEYNLRGLPSDRCPECGQAFDRPALLRSRVPWMHRKEIG